MSSRDRLPFETVTADPAAAPAAAAVVADAPLQALLAARGLGSSPAPFHGAVTGELAGFNELDGSPLVTSPHHATPVPARSVVELLPAMAGRPVVLMFDGGDPSRPLVMGVVHSPRPGAEGVVPADALAARPRTLVLEAQDEIVLRNRHAKIRLTADGDIEVTGTSFTTRTQRLLRLLSPLIKLN